MTWDDPDTWIGDAGDMSEYQTVTTDQVVDGVNRTLRMVLGHGGSPRLTATDLGLRPGLPFLVAR